MARFDKLRWVEYLWLLLGIFKKAFDLCNSWVRQGMCKKLSWDFCFVFKNDLFFVNGSDKHVLLLPILWWVNVFKKMFKKCLNVVVFTHPMGCYTYEIWNVNVTSSPVCVLYYCKGYVVSNLEAKNQKLMLVANNWHWSSPS